MAAAVAALGEGRGDAGCAVRGSGGGSSLEGMMLRITYSAIFQLRTLINTSI